MGVLNLTFIPRLESDVIFLTPTLLTCAVHNYLVQSPMFIFGNILATDVSVH